MLGLLLLLGMVPRGGDIASGPFAPHLAADPSTQWRLGARESWRSFQVKWPGRWGVRWSAANATPRFLWAPGVDAGRADALVADVAALAGVDPAELDVARVTQRDDRVITQWTRRWRGAPVEGDQIAVVAIRGRIAAVWVQLTPIGLRTDPRPGERVLPTPPKGDPRLVRRSVEGGLVVYRDRDGRVAHVTDPRLYGAVTATYEERTYGDPLVSDAARAITLTDADGATAVTGDDGSHALGGALEAWLDGPTLAVTENGAALRVATTEDGELGAGADIPYAAATVLHHFHVVWDWLADRRPTHAWLADRVPADVEQAAGTCNAYYTSGTINFLPGSESCNDLGRIADVVYHEVGHGIHEYILAAGTFASDVSEGSSDYVAATILEDPTLAPNAYPGGGYIREIATDRRYPDDIVHEPHNDGLVWASFLWNLRADWGADATDALFLGALEQGPTLTDLYEAVIVADDDDGDLTDGTPHGCELMERLAEHGLGPGPIGVVRFDHTPLGPQPSDAEGYEVRFELADLLPDCSGLDAGSVALWYSVNGAPVPPEVGFRGDTGDTGDTGATGDPGDPYVGWSRVALAPDGDAWVGTIPRQVAGTRVRYFLQAASTDGTQIVRTDGGDEDTVYAFWVGDRAVVWCEDFEAGFPTGWTHGAAGGVDEWVTGAPVGGATWDPDAPGDGAVHAATVLDGDYTPSVSEWLRSPVIPVGDPGPMTLLTYQRWLTVEDALYDHADLTANGVNVWANAGTPGGTDHHLDVAWTAHELPALPLLDAAGDLQLTWSLASDAGLEFGGWAIDAVCVVTLADVPGHYRVRDLSATDDEAQVTVTWTQPWMAPLSATVLVRKAGDWPTGPEDGVILDVEFDPTPGEARLVVDTDAVEGERFHYALFAAGQHDGDWHLDLVTGENADEGGIPAAAPPEDTGDTGAADTADGDPDGDPDGEPDADGDPDEPDARCGCAADAGGVGWIGLVAVGAALGARRRRRLP